MKFVTDLSFSEMLAIIAAKQGKMPAELIARYMNNLLYTLPTDENGNLPKGAVEQAYNEAGLDLQTRMNMAEALLNDPRNQNTPASQQVLQALTETFGVDKALDRIAYEQVAGYEAPANQDVLNLKWEQEFGSGSYELMKMKLMSGLGSFEDKVQFLQFENQAYAEHLDIAPRELVFYSNDPNSKGYQSGKTIGINVNTPEFANNFMATVGTLRHENNHGLQQTMAAEYHSGELNNAPEGVRMLGQLYSIGLRSYVSPEQGYAAYATQAVEVDCQAVNKYTELFAGYKAAQYGMFRTPQNEAVQHKQQFACAA